MANHPIPYRISFAELTPTYSTIREYVEQIFGMVYEFAEYDFGFSWGLEIFDTETDSRHELLKFLKAHNLQTEVHLNEAALADIMQTSHLFHSEAAIFLADMNVDRVIFNLNIGDASYNITDDNYKAERPLELVDYMKARGCKQPQVVLICNKTTVDYINKSLKLQQEQADVGLSSEDLGVMFCPYKAGANSYKEFKSPDEQGLEYPCKHIEYSGGMGMNDNIFSVLSILDSFGLDPLNVTTRAAVLTDQKFDFDKARKFVRNICTWKGAIGK
ncbi:MAG: hypothetical protein FWD33_04085 [Alphaproteobacteria bacterium]|nr:hypothetical protein [Alphaproteobacteria bacterium]